MMISREQLLQLSGVEYNYIVENVDDETADLMYLLRADMLLGEVEIDDELLPIRFLLERVSYNG